MQGVQYDTLDTDNLGEDIARYTSIPKEAIVRNIHYNLLREAAKRWIESLGESERDTVHFYCHHCKETSTYSRQYVEIMRRENVIWWMCPICGVKDYFEDILRQSDYDST